MTRKVAIFDNDDALKFLDNARNKIDQVRTYLMLAFGMHPENLRRLTVGNKGNITPEGVLEFKRAKNANPRRELLSRDQAQVIITIVKQGKLKISNRAYEMICDTQGKVLRDYPTPPVSPLTLRHTYILNMLRQFDFDMELVALKAGCKVQTVRLNYIDLRDWEKIHKQEFHKPLDLTHWDFKE